MKKGFSLIEIVLAIVIIAISMMSVPMILTQTSKSNEFSIIQESILASSTKMINILSYYWDKNSYDKENKILRTLDVTNGDSELDRIVATPSINDNNLRIGHLYYDKRRRFFDFILVGKTYPDTSINVSNQESINDFHDKTATIGGSGAYDYKDSKIALTSKIYYIPDNTDYSKTDIHFTFTTPTSTPITNNKSTNIKMIVVDTVSPLLGRHLVLRSFESNVGQSKLLIRPK